MADDCTLEGRPQGPEGVGERRRALGLFRRLLGDKRGVNALEFALVAPVVLLLIATVPELGTILLEQALLDNATASASRLIKISPSTTTQSIFVNALCTDQGLNSMIATSTCTTGLQVRVQSAATFGAISNTLTTDSNGNITNTGYNAGGSASRVLVQVGFSRAFVTPWLGQFMGKNGHLLLISTVVFQNET